MAAAAAPEEEEESGAPAVAPQGEVGREQTLDFMVGQFLQALGADGCHLFTKCYSHLYKARPEFTKRVYNQFISQLQNSVQEEVQALKEEGNLPVLLDSLDKLERAAEGKEGPAWRPSGLPEEDARRVVVPYLLKQRRRLQKSLKEKQESNAQLAAAVVAGRQRIAALQAQVHQQREEWQGIAIDGRKTMGTVEDLS